MPEVFEAEFDKYHIIRKLGSGGFADVYLAQQEGLRRLVALKVLKRLFNGDPSLVRRFAVEADNASALQHPNIVTIHDVGEFEGRRFIVMEYVEGQSLEALLKAGNLPAPRALHILEQVASALDYAHSRGLTHRDVKPGNILIGRDDASGDPDRAKLADFGLVRASEATVVTSLNQVLGSPAYMAPEQLETERNAEIGPTTDIYALGIVAYEMLAGRPPFAGNTTAVISAHLTRNARPITEVNPDVPAAVWKALAPALAKAVETRPTSATALVAALKAAYAAESNGPIIDPPLKPRGLPRAWAVVLAVAAVALIAALVALLNRPASVVVVEQLITTTPVVVEKIVTQALNQMVEVEVTRVVALPATPEPTRTATRPPTAAPNTPSPTATPESEVTQIVTPRASATRLSSTPTARATARPTPAPIRAKTYPAPILIAPDGVVIESNRVRLEWRTGGRALKSTEGYAVLLWRADAAGLQALRGLDLPSQFDACARAYRNEDWELELNNPTQPGRYKWSVVVVDLAQRDARGRCLVVSEQPGAMEFRWVGEAAPPPVDAPPPTDIPTPELPPTDTPTPESPPTDTPTPEPPPTDAPTPEPTPAGAQPPVDSAPAPQQTRPQNGW